MIEQSGDGLTQPALRSDDGLVVPADDGFTEETESTKKDDDLQAPEGCGIDGIVMTEVVQQFPGCIKGQRPAMMDMADVMEDDIYALIL